MNPQPRTRYFTTEGAVASNTHPHSAVVDVQTEDQLLISRRLGTAAGLFRGDSLETHPDSDIHFGWL